MWHDARLECLLASLATRQMESPFTLCNLLKLFCGYCAGNGQHCIQPAQPHGHPVVLVGVSSEAIVNDQDHRAGRLRQAGSGTECNRGRHVLLRLRHRRRDHYEQSLAGPRFRTLCRAAEVRVLPQKVPQPIHGPHHGPQQGPWRGIVSFGKIVTCSWHGSSGVVEDDHGVPVILGSLGYVDGYSGNNNYSMNYLTAL